MIQGNIDLMSTVVRLTSQTAAALVLPHSLAARRREHDNMLLPHMVVKGKVGSIPVQFYCLSHHIKSIEIACGISDVWAGSMYWSEQIWYELSEQIWYELYNCFAVFKPISPGLVCMTHFLDLLKHYDVAAREEVV